MDDSEARYLIDQYNAFASWRTRAWETYFGFGAMVISANALYLSSVPPEDRVWWWWGIVALCFIVLANVGDWHGGRTRSEYAKRLTLLEGYRSRFKSLPDTICFQRIADSKLRTKELRDLLQEAERSIMKAGHL